MSTYDTTLSQDDIYDILSSARRRYILLQLKQRQGPIELTELAEELAAWENDAPVADLPQEDRKRVYVSLYQTHIPKLDDAGLVEYDSDSGLVAIRRDRTAIDSYLPCGDAEPYWYRVYMIAAILNGVFFTAVTLDIVPIGQFLASLIVVVSFVGVTLAHAVSVRRADFSYRLD
jgi:hypothetical protein